MRRVFLSFNGGQVVGSVVECSKLGWTVKAQYRVPVKMWEGL